ncbi:MAG: AAA family ATPase [Actinobacteria bacterium]|nr:AAA family ATPase [Actinomycetota bacterium]
MTARHFPAELLFADVSERIVFDELKKRLPSEAVIFCNERLSDSGQELEIDFIVAWPGVGVAVLEVKGGQIRSNEDSTFKQGDARGWHDIDPMTQVRKNMYGLNGYISRLWSRRALSSKALIVFPHAEIPSSYSRPDIPREIVVDKVDLVSIADRIQTVLRNHHYRPEQIDIDILIQKFSGHSAAQVSLLDVRKNREKALVQLTEDQLAILATLRRSKRFAILGAAGCGKTFVAIEQARHRVLAGDRVLFLCYNRGLAAYINKRFEALPESERPEAIKTLHALGPKWGYQIDGDQTSMREYWDEVVPAALAQLATNLQEDEKYDTIIIDEAQDFHPDWWKVVTGALKDSEAGRIYAFGDLEQGVFHSHPDIPLSLCEIVLDKNIRNSLPIAELAALCIQDSPESAGLDGPPVRLVSATDETATALADQQVVALISEGWSPADICVLTTGDSHPKKKSTETVQGSVGYRESFFSGQDVFYGHALGFKGLERSAIVLAINGWKHPDQKKEMLYSAVTRARDLLIICAEEETLKQAGGREFVKLVKRRSELAAQ